MRVSFYEIFNINPNGSISPKKQVKIGGVTMGPGVTFGKGVQMGGIAIANYVGQDLEVEYEGNIVILKQIYPSA